VDAEDPPLRFAVGAGVLPRARAAYADRLATWEAWEAVSERSTRRIEETHRRSILAGQPTNRTPDKALSCGSLLVHVLWEIQLRLFVKYDFSLECYDSS
jgi:hypothetical protein